MPCRTTSTSSRRWPHALLMVGLVLALGLASEGAWARRVALLVGVGAYPGLQAPAQLQGPASDVDAMRAVLTERWGFDPKDVVVLKDRGATKAAILRELAELQRRSTSGDEVLIYFSGHGTSAFDSVNATPVPHGSGAFVPSDFNTASAARGVDGLIVGRRDLLPLLQALDQGERQLWVISDSCYSGQQVRSVQLFDDDELPSRMVPLALGREAVDQRADLAKAGSAGAPPPYPYRRVAYLAAAAEGERARDISGPALARVPTLDGQPHGALTDALLRVLSGRLPADLDGDGQLSLVEVHRAVADFMGQRAYGHTPQRLPSVAEDGHGLGQRPVLSMRGVAATVQRARLEPLRVRAEVYRGRALTDAQRSAVRQVADVVLLGPDAPQADIVLRATDQDLVVLAASGDLLIGMDAGNLVSLAGQLQQLAWAKRIRQLAEQNRRGALPLEVEPAAKGGNFKLGEHMAFVVRPEREATLLLLNVNAAGNVSVLYPHSADERAPLLARQPRYIPGEADHKHVLVTPPLGMDLQFAFAFDAPPPGLDQLTGLVNAPPTSESLRRLEQALQTMKGRFTFASSETRALKP